MWGDGVQLAFLSEACLVDADSAQGGKLRWLAENEGPWGADLDPHSCPDTCQP